MAGNKNGYRAGTTKTYIKNLMTTVEINDKFVTAGWLGKRRQPRPSIVRLFRPINTNGR